MFARRCATVRNHSQPFATVPNRPREDHMAVPMVSSTKGVTFRVFQLRVSSFRMVGVALCDIPTCVMTCQKWFCVAGAEDALHFSWQAQHFGDLPCHFAWQPQHLRRVVLFPTIVDPARLFKTCKKIEGNQHENFDLGCTEQMPFV